MTTLQSQGLSAQVNTNTSSIEPDCDPLPVQLCARFLGARSSRVCDRPLPEITEGLVERVRQVHAWVEHARQHHDILQSRELVEAAQSYNGVIGRYLETLKSRNNPKYWDYQKALTHSPQSFQDHENRLKAEFALCSDSSGRHFFHFRNAVADLYKKEALKAGHTLSL